MIRADEQLIFFPTLARPLGGDRWDAALHGVLFRPALGSIRRKLLTRLIARAAGVRHDEVLSPRLAERLAPFLVDNKRRRSVRVRIWNELVRMGPSSAGGHLHGRVTLRACAERVVTFGTHEEETPGRTFAGRIHLLRPEGLSVVCDVDDTIKHSNVPDKRELLRNTFLNPFRPVDAVAVFCRACAAAGAEFHYVSASPWQLYSLLSAFLAEHDLPQGSFHLKRFRLKDRSAISLLAPPQRFKLSAIEPLLKSWPRRRFVLLGDIAEKDPEIYGELARRHPRQVAMIVVRNHAPLPGDDSRLRAAFRSVDKRRWAVRTDADDWAAAAADAIRFASRAG